MSNSATHRPVAAAQTTGNWAMEFTLLFEEFQVLIRLLMNAGYLVEGWDMETCFDYEYLKYYEILIHKSVYTYLNEHNKIYRRRSGQRFVLYR